jgi:hypothetical protein
MVCLTPIARTVAQMITRLHRLDNRAPDASLLGLANTNKRQRDIDAGQEAPRLDDRFSNHGTDDPLLSH